MWPCSLNIEVAELQLISDKYLSRSEADIPMLAELLKIGQMSGTADIIGEYEGELARAFGSRSAVAVSSGSTALQAALVMLNARPGSEVLVPATAPLPSVFPISACGLIPVPVDVQPDSVGFDLADLAAKITEKTCAALSVPLWGYPIDNSGSLAVLKAAGIPLIEDAAHAHGTSIGRKKVGTFGSVGCFSTHDRKLLATGEGGFILTDDEDLANRMRAYIRLGNLSGDSVGVNFKLNAMAAAIGLARLPQLETIISTRTDNARRTLDGIGDLHQYKELQYPGDGAPNYYNLTLILVEEDRAKARGQLQALSAAGLAIDQVKYGYDVFYRRNAYRHMEYCCPNAEALIDRLVQVPVHPGLSESEKVGVVNILRGIE